MSNKVKIRYPKRRFKKDINKMTFGVPEPVRKNMYDVVLNNFQASDRKTFLHRLIYIGEHHFSKKDDTLVEIFHNTVKQANERYHIDELTGMLLYYDNYYVHVLEGDEDTIYNQVYNFLSIHDKRFGRCRVMSFGSHIHQRLTCDWYHHYGVPQRLLGQLDLNCSIQEAGRLYYMCIRKMITFLLNFFQPNQLQMIDDTESGMSIEVTSLVLSRSNTISSLVESKSRDWSGASLKEPSTSFRANKDPLRPMLPETEVLHFVLNFPDSLSLQGFHELYGVIPQRNIYKDRVWPIASDFIPYDMLCKPFQMITELPKPGRTPRKSETTISELDQVSLI